MFFNLLVHFDKFGKKCNGGIKHSVYDYPKQEKKTSCMG